MNYRKTVLILLTSFMALLLKAGDHDLLVGPVLQKTQSLYWENGVGVSYSSDQILNKHIEFNFKYLSSRLGSAIGTNAVKQDQINLGADWIFNPHKSWQFYAGLMTGYFMADFEEPMFDVLPQNSPLFALNFGTAYDFKKVKARLGMGYNLINGEGDQVPGTLFPLFYQLSVMIPIRL